MLTRFIATCLAALILVFSAPAAAQPALPSGGSKVLVDGGRADAATVEIDGEPLFRVIGVSAFPAARRAARDAERIKALARDKTFDPANLSITQLDGITTIVASGKTVTQITDADAVLEGVSLATLASVNLTRIQRAIIEYRAERTRDALLGSAGRALGAMVLAAALCVLLRWLFKVARRQLQRAEERSAAKPGDTVIPALRPDTLQSVAQQALRALQVVVVLALAVFWLQYVLGQLPFTRGFARQMLGYVMAPLQTVGQGLLGAVPDLIFLAVLYLMTRFVLVLMRQSFTAVEAGRLTVPGFNRDWAQPTYKLLRLVVVLLALVVGYPYIPGSGSAAFQGITLFLGIVASLGSSSAIANIIAGYLLIYRRAFKVGDLVLLAGNLGQISAMRLQATHLKTIKNEEVTIPNSAVMAKEVVNYSALCASSGLILHTKVVVGYDTPWRQVEAMLLDAVQRTSGLMAQPAPFVRELELGNAGVTYELNAYCDNPLAVASLYAAILRNVLDVLDENGIDPVTPTHVALTADARAHKVVPKEAHGT